jgi:2-iminobutanoate/2-iminopropanoate deaminase
MKVCLNEWEVWFADVPFEDGNGHKPRPVVILESINEDVTIVPIVPLTSHAPRYGEYALQFWADAGLRFPTTARIFKRYKIHIDKFSFKIGTLHKSDIFILSDKLQTNSSQEAHAMAQIILTAKAPAPIGPYSQAILAGGTLYCSGAIPVDPITGDIPAGIEAQAELAISNLLAVLSEAGFFAVDVVKTTCFLTDMGDFAAFNAVYAKYFTGAPARSCVVVSALPKGVSVEIEAVAVSGV